MFDWVGERFADLAAAGGEIVVGIWVAVCMAVWHAGLWVLGIVLDIGDWFTRPNLDPRGGGGLAKVYSYTLWIGLSIALILLVVSLLAGVLKRDGKSLGETVLGAVKFLLVCTIWYSYCGGVVVAVDGINTALRTELLGSGNLGTLMQDRLDTIPEGAATAVIATVLLLLGLVLWLGAIAYIVVMLGRAVALIVLTATAPIAAAGLLYKPLESWFWKSFRWFHSAAVTPILITLMLGMGIQLASGAALGLEDSGQEAVALAIPSVMMIVVAAISPMALFKLLAFVDPGSSSGAAFRAGLAGPNSAGGGLDKLGSKLHSTDAGGGSSSAPAGGGASMSGQQALAATGGGASAGGAAAGGAAAGGGAAAAGGGAAAAGLGPAGVAVMGAQKLVGAFKAAGAAMTGMVTDTASGMGVGDSSYPYDPSGDARASNHPMQRQQQSTSPAGSPSPVESGGASPPTNGAGSASAGSAADGGAAVAPTAPEANSTPTQPDGGAGDPNMAAAGHGQRPVPQPVVEAEDRNGGTHV